jgi:hypothetical protein
MLESHGALQCRYWVAVLAQISQNRWAVWVRCGAPPERIESWILKWPTTTNLSEGNGHWRDAFSLVMNPVWLLEQSLHGVITPFEIGARKKRMDVCMLRRQWWRYVESFASCYKQSKSIYLQAFLELRCRLFVVQVYETCLYKLIKDLG